MDDQKKRFKIKEFLINNLLQFSCVDKYLLCASALIWCFFFFCSYDDSWILPCFVVVYLYRLGTVNSNTVNSKLHLIRSYYEIFFYHFPNISCLKCTVKSNFHLIRSKTLLTNDFELTVPNL